MATAIVTATGPRTLFGDIATRLGTRVPETEFESGLRRFSLLILWTTSPLIYFSRASSPEQLKLNPRLMISPPGDPSY